MRLIPSRIQVSTHINEDADKIAPDNLYKQSLKFRKDYWYKIYIEAK